MEHYEVQQEKQQNCNLQDVARSRQENDVLKKLHQESKSRLSIKEDVLRSDDKR